MQVLSSLWSSLKWILLLQLFIAGTAHAREPISPIEWPQQITDEMLLGKKLFFDPLLSQKQDMSCASCHLFEHGGSIPKAKALQDNGTLSRYNPSSVFNLSHNYPLGWEGQILSIQQQISTLMFKESIMGLNWEQLVTRLKADPQYPEQFKTIYEEGITPDTVALAITQFEIGLSTPSPFDAYLKGDEQAISEDAQLGYELFKRYGCVSCHQGEKVGGNLLQKLGVIEPYAYDPDSNSPTNLGRYNTTNSEQDIQVFRVPSLRNVADTPPYFHDGSVDNLEQVVSLMARHQLGREIPATDIRLIVEFLKSLSGLPHPELMP